MKYQWALIVGAAWAARYLGRERDDATHKPDPSAQEEVMPSSHEVLAEYRKVLVAADQKAQEDFDKTIISLSGGGLAVSLVFLKDVVGQAAVIWPWALMAAWACWGISTLVVLLSYHFSHRTIQDGIKSIDEGRAYDGNWGGAYGLWTRRLNGWGAALFFLGVLSILIFTCANFYAKGNANAKQPPIASTAGPASAPGSAPARLGAASAP